MEYYKILVNRINEFCQMRNLSTRALAKMCGLSRTSISNIIQGKSKNPRIQTLHRIATGLNMTLSEFLDIKELNEYEFESKEDDE